jgi:hypothetical protein
MYFTDRGIEELEARRGDDEISVAWLAERLRDFVNLNPSFDTAVDRLATWLARLDDEEDLLSLNVLWCLWPCLELPSSSHIRIFRIFHHLPLWSQPRGC